MTSRFAPVPPDTRPAACRNCGAPVSGEYCAACGQETALKLPTARVFLREATGRYFSLDGRMWRTLLALLLRPGFLTREYLEGRRRRYIRPARLFLVLSLALFAALRLFVSAPKLVEFQADDAAAAPAKAAQTAKAAKRADGDARKAGAASAAPAAPAAPDDDTVIKFDPGEEGGDLLSLPGFSVHVDREFNFDITDADHPLARELKRRITQFNRLDRQGKSEQVFLGVVRYGPYAMFVLMPAYALLLLAVYAGSGRRYPDRPRRYAEHLVFAAHNHAFLFLVGVLLLAIPYAPLRIALACWGTLYGFAALKSVYRGGWPGLLARNSIVALAYVVLFALVVVGLILAAVVLR